MDEMLSQVEEAAGLEPHIAKAAIGQVLLFLRDEAPGERIAAFIDQNPHAREFVSAARARSDGGVTQVIEGFKSFMGHGRWDFNALAGKLENLGLTEAQTDSLLRIVLDRAETLIGDEDIAKIREGLPALMMRSAPYRRLEDRPL